MWGRETISPEDDKAAKCLGIQVGVEGRQKHRFLYLEEGLFPEKVAAEVRISERENLRNKVAMPKFDTGDSSLLSRPLTRGRQ